MVRNYKRNSDRKKWPQTNLTAAIKAVGSGTSVRRAALVHRVPRETLKRYLRQADPLEAQQLGAFANVFTAAQEVELVGYILSMEQRFYGVTTREIRKLAFDLAERNGIPHPFNKQKQLAGIDWLAGFRKRHPQLSLRTPEATSAARAQGFNRVAVEKFFDLLQAILQKRNIPASRRYNVDETSVTPVNA